MQMMNAPPAPKTTKSSWPWFLLGLLWCVALLNYLDRQVIFSIFPLLQRDLHATSLQLGLCGSLFLLFYGLASPFAGYAADRFGHRRIILLSLVIWSIAGLVAGQVHNMPQMLLTRAAMGLSEAFYIPAALGLLVSVHSARTRSLATGIHQSGIYAGVIAGGTLGGLAEHTYSWRSLFLVLGLCGVIYGVLLASLLRRTALTSTQACRTAFTPMLSNRSLQVYTLVFMVFSVATWMLYTWLPLYLYEHLHLSLAAAGFQATFWLQTASFAGAFGGGALSDRLALRTPGVRLLVQGGGLALACPFLLLISHTTSMVLVILALVSIGLGRGCFDANTAPITADMVGAERCSSAYGILNCAGCIVAGFTTLAGGWLRQHVSFSVVFTAAGAVLVVGVVCLLMLARARQAPPPSLT